MPPKKQPTVWKAEPHTIAKIQILQAYLNAWFQILGRSRRGQDLLYVDGFAGPGEYTNSSCGSPISALDAAREALATSGSQWVAGDIHCVFIEEDPARSAHLGNRVQPFQNTARLHIHLFQSSFVDGLSHLKAQFPRAFQLSHPLFVFIDPFGATGAPFSTVADILRSACSEVLINLDADGIARILKAGSSADHEAVLTEILGDRSWSVIELENQPFGQVCVALLALYVQRLRSLPNVRYVFPFEMRTHSSTLNYFLVFASQHPLGLEKMKEAMRKIDETGSYRFTDARVNQPVLFRFDQPGDWSPVLLDMFRGTRASYESLRDFALNKTPFVNPKSMLKDLETQGSIRVVSRDPKRRRGTFNEDKLDYVEFG